MQHRENLKIDARTGRIAGVRHIASPNCDDRPSGCEPELIVVHGISLPPGEFGGPWIEHLFQNTLPPEEHEYFAGIVHLRVSAHAFIARSGDITQFVPFRMRAWHCGESTYCGRDACNDFSVGIELEGTDEQPYEPAQYESLVALIGALRATYPSLRDADIVGHSDIAPGRKTDPGVAFDWNLLRERLSLA